MTHETFREFYDVSNNALRAISADDVVGVDRTRTDQATLVLRDRSRVATTQYFTEVVKWLNAHHDATRGGSE